MQSSPETSAFTHFNAQGHAHMVDISNKALTKRCALAYGEIWMQTSTLALIASGNAQKGDVLGVARIAGIMAAKKTSEIIPLCHPLVLSHVTIDFALVAASGAQTLAQVQCSANVTSTGSTGVEMEALQAVQTALLTIYDMCKAVDKGMQMMHIMLLEKHGGKSGSWRHPRYEELAAKQE